MRKITWLLLFALALFLGGCGATTKGKEIDTRTTINIYDNTGTVNIDPTLATSSGDQEQMVEAPNTVDVPLDLDLDVEGIGEETLEKAALKTTNALLNNEAKELIEEVNLLPGGEVDTSQPEELQGHSLMKVIPFVGDLAGVQDGEGATTLRKFKLDKLGKEYPGSFIFVFSDDKVLKVPDSRYVTRAENGTLRRYHPGGVEPSIVVAEVLAEKGTSPDSVAVYYKPKEE